MPPGQCLRCGAWWKHKAKDCPENPTCDFCGKPHATEVCFAKRKAERRAARLGAAAPEPAQATSAPARERPGRKRSTGRRSLSFAELRKRLTRLRLRPRPVPPPPPPQRAAAKRQAAWPAAKELPRPPPPPPQLPRQLKEPARKDLKGEDERHTNGEGKQKRRQKPRWGERTGRPQSGTTRGRTRGERARRPRREAARQGHRGERTRRPPAPRHEAPEREAEEGPALGWPSRTPELWEASFDQQRLQQRLAGELEQLRLEHFEQLEGSGERAHAARASDSEAGGEEADGQRSPLQGKHTPEGRSATAPLPLSEASTAASETELHGGGCGSAKPLELPETLRLPLAGIPWADAALDEQDGASVKATARETASQREPAAAEKDDAEKAAARAEWLRLVALEPLYRQAEGDQLGQPGEAWCSLARAQPRSGGRGKPAGRRRGRAAPAAPD